MVGLLVELLVDVEIAKLSAIRIPLITAIQKSTKIKINSEKIAAKSNDQNFGFQKIEIK